MKLLWIAPLLFFVAILAAILLWPAVPKPNCNDFLNNKLEDCTMELRK